MADDKSWEEQADESDARQPPTRIQQRPNPAASAFNFVPGQVFTPGQAYQPPHQQQPQQHQFQQYQQYQQPYQNYQAQGYAAPQYGAQQYGGQPYGGQQYAGQPYQAPPSQAAPPQQQQIPIRTVNPLAPSSNTSAASSSTPALAPKAKVLSLSLGGDIKPTSKAAPIAKEASKASDEKPASKGAPVAAPATAVKPTKSSDTAPAAKPAEAPAKAAEKAKPVEIDAVEKELEEVVDAETLREMYGKEHVNVIFLGHVDAGKSTLGGSILYATGMVDERTLDKYKREAKEAGRETWFLSWALDLTKEERSKGKTVEVGRGHFETEKRKYSILDAPGHKNFVPSMIGGAAQADVGVLVISARKGEFETGFEKGGQTREHAMLAKTQGVNKLAVAINKMDDPTVEWKKTRFDECVTKITPYLKGLGFNPKTDIIFIPLSAQTTIGVKDRVPKDICPWYDGPSLLEYLDGMQSLERKVSAPFMMPISAKYRDLGTMIEGKIEAGVIRKDETYLLMPNRETVTLSALYGEGEEEIPKAMAGDQIRARLRNIDEESILPGFVLCSVKRPVHYVSSFDAQIQILPELKSILTAGFNCVMHVHSAQEEVTFTALLHKLEKGTGRKSKKPPTHATKGMQIIARLEVISAVGQNSVCLEKYTDYPQMGRFTLRDQGVTIAIGKVLNLVAETDV